MIGNVIGKRRNARSGEEDAIVFPRMPERNLAFFGDFEKGAFSRSLCKKEDTDTRRVFGIARNLKIAAKAHFAEIEFSGERCVLPFGQFAKA